LDKSVAGNSDIFDLIGNISIKGIDKAEKGLQSIDKTAENSGSKISGFIGKMQSISLALVGIPVALQGLTKVKDFFSGFINNASDLNESINKNQVLFGDYSNQIVDFSKTSARNLGISQNAALEATGIFGNLFRALDIGQKPATDMSTSLVTLAADLASFNNASPEEALQALRSGLVGETEPLRKFGVNINDAAIKAQAAKLGLQGVNGELTAGQKAQAVYALMMEQTKLAQGDFARTSDGLANAQRILKAEFQDISTRIGSVLLPIVVKAVGIFAKILPDAIDFSTRVLTALGNILSGPFHTVLTVVIDAFKTFIAALQGKWTDDSKILGIHRAIGNIGLVIRNDVIPAIESIANFVQKNLVPIFQKAFSFISKNWRDVATVIWPVYSLIVRFADAVGDKGFLGALKDIPSILGDVFKSFGKVLGPIFDFLWDAAKKVDWIGLAKTILGYLWSAIKILAGEIGTGVSWLYNWISNEIGKIDWGALGKSLIDYFITGVSIAASGIAAGVSWIYNWISNQISQIDWGSLASTLLTYFITGISTAVSTIAAGASWLYNWISNQISQIDWSALGSSIINALQSAVGSIDNIISGGASTASASLPGLPIDTGFIDSLTSALNDKLMPALSTVGNYLSSTFGPALSSLRDSFSEVWTVLSTNFNPLMEKLRGLFESLQPAIGLVITILKDLGIGIGAIIGVLTILVTQIMAKAINIFADVFPGAIQVAIDIIGVMISSLQTIIDFVTGMVRIISDLLHGDFSGAWQDARNMVSKVKDDIIGLVTGLKDTVVDILNTLKTLIISLFGDAVSWLYQAGMDIINGLINGINLVLSTVGSVIAGVKTTITSAFSGALDWLYSIGQSIIQGLWNGIVSMGSWLTSTISGWIKSVIPDPIAKALGFGSPAKIMIPIGKGIVEGLAKGITDNRQLLINAADSTVDTIVDALIKGVENGVSAGRITDALTDDLLLPSLLKAQQDIAEKLDLAKLSGADAETLAQYEKDLNAINRLIEQWLKQHKTTIDQYMKEATDAFALENEQQRIVDGWQSTFDNIDNILSGEAIPALQAQFDALQLKLRLALVNNLPQEIVNGIRADMAAIQQEISNASIVFQTALDAGFIQPIQKMNAETLQQLESLLQEVGDKGTSLIDSIVTAIEKGQISLQYAASIIPESMLPAIAEVLQSLKVDLAQALLDGTDPTGIQRNIEVIQALLKELGYTAEETASQLDSMSQSAANAATASISAAGTPSNVPDTQIDPNTGMLTPEAYTYGFLNPGTVSSELMKEYYKAHNNNATWLAQHPVINVLVQVGNEALEDRFVKVIQRERPVR
jgi:phage-related protein